MSVFEQKARQILGKADIEIGGNQPWDMQVGNPRLYSRILRQGSIGLGEAYMDGWWDAEALDQFFDHLLRTRINRREPWLQKWLLTTLATLTNRQSFARAFQVGEEHYDLGNDLYEAMLDPTLAYTCGYWKDAKTLEEAQIAKMDLICRKIDLRKGQTVLDIGCGWASFAKFAAERYGAKVVGTTVSKEQVVLARKRCEGLPVEIRLEDYRDTKGSFDHIVSIGMFEQVGYKNYEVFMRKAASLLKEEGLFLLHTIGGNRSEVRTDPWIDRYIFPNGMLPSIKQIGASLEDVFVMEDWHNFGADYDKTLMAWHANFQAAWPTLAPKYGERFKRMWEYYLLACAGSFRARKNQLWQIVLSKRGVPGGYRSLR
ncbi:MAG: cyclopropane fatty acyl phospholipid synthase [Candidatus Moraniibacteriota bacterium]